MSVTVFPAASWTKIWNSRFDNCRCGGAGASPVAASASASASDALTYLRPAATVPIRPRSLAAVPALEKKSACACPQKVDGILLFRMHADDQDRQLRLSAPERSYRIENRRVGQRDIEQHDVARLRGDQRQRICGRPRLAR